jgi:hypothetical protein
MILLPARGTVPGKFAVAEVRLIEFCFDEV